MTFNELVKIVLESQSLNEDNLVLCIDVEDSSTPSVRVFSIKKENMSFFRKKMSTNNASGIIKTTISGLDLYKDTPIHFKSPEYEARLNASSIISILDKKLRECDSKIGEWYYSETWGRSLDYGGRITCFFFVLSEDAYKGIKHTAGELEGF